MRWPCMFALAAGIATSLSTPAHAGRRTYHFLDESGNPLALRAPVVDLSAPNPAGRALFFQPLELSGVDRPQFAQQGIPLPDNVANALILTGGAVLLGTVIADFLRHH